MSLLLLIAIQNAARIFFHSDCGSPVISSLVFPFNDM